MSFVGFFFPQKQLEITKKKKKKIWYENASHTAISTELLMRCNAFCERLRTSAFAYLLSSAIYIH